MQDLISQVEDLAGIEIDHTTSMVMIFGIIFLTAVVVHIFLHWVVLRTFEKRAIASSRLWLQIITQNKLFHRLAFTLQGIIVNIQAVFWLQKGTEAADILTTCAQLWIMMYALLSVFSSAAAPSPAPAAATTTPAAADTPNSSSQAFTKSFNSNTLNSLIASINSAVVIFAMIIFLHLILRLYHDDTFSARRSLRLFSLHSIRIILPESLLLLLQELPLPEQPLLPRQLRRPFLRSD